MTESHNVSELEHVRWLIECADEELVEDLPADPLKLATHFRKRHGPERSRLLCELKELRTRAASKFSSASKMFFTRRGFEQSTSELIANYKAGRFPERAKAIDLCCGVGGDAIALAKVAAELTIVDSSAPLVEMAKRNLQIHGAENFAAQICDVRESDLSPFEAWHIDPDRRVDDRRRSAPEECEPPLEEFLDSLQESGAAMNGGIKLSPAANAEHLLQRGAELEWIGSVRECQQQVAWFGDLAKHPGKRTATWLSGQGSPPYSETLVEMTDSQVTTATDWPNRQLRFIYEPRPSVLAARLDPSLAARFEMLRLPTSASWLASNEESESTLFSRFEIVASFPFRQKAVVTIAESIAATGHRITEVKTRGVDVEPTKLLRELSAHGGGDNKPAVLILVSIGQSLHAIVAERTTA